LLAPDLARGLVVAEAHVARMAEPAVARPLAELDLDDELRLHPRDVALPNARHLQRFGKRRGRSLEGTEQRQETLDLPVAEPGTGVSDPPPRAVVVHGEHERADARSAPAFPARVSRNRELLPTRRLDLEPLAR